MGTEPVKTPSPLRLVGLLLVLGTAGLYYRLVELVEAGAPHSIKSTEVLVALANLVCVVTGFYLLGRGRRVFPCR